MGNSVGQLLENSTKSHLAIETTNSINDVATKLKCCCSSKAGMSVAGWACVDLPRPRLRKPTHAAGPFRLAAARNPGGGGVPTGPPIRERCHDRRPGLPRLPLPGRDHPVGGALV